MSASTVDERSLETAAKDGTLALEEWPRVLENVLRKLHNIVHNDFPVPQLPIHDADVINSTPPILPSSGDPIPPNSQQSTKENDAPEPAGTLPPDLLSSYQSSVRTLERDFSESPPYTIQRLAELVLQPRKHYRFLPAYLRALDRVVSVSSPTSDFPLPTGINAGGFLANGELNGIQEREGLGSDESLGGALLTPIPWLQRNSNSQEGEFHSERMDTILGPNGAGSIETVTVTVNGVPSASSAAHTSQSTSTPPSPTLSEQSDASTNSSESVDAQLREQGGVTQGELLRQEQEAGVVPFGQTTTRRLAATRPRVGASNTVLETVESSDDMPHARGPDEIGLEDTGPVQNSGLIDMEAAVGRGRSKSPQPPIHEDEAVEGKVERLREAIDSEGEKAERDEDGDTQIHDAGAASTNAST